MLDIIPMRSEDTMKWYNVSAISLALLNGINSRLTIADFEALCLGVPKPVNTTCSWRGFDEREDKKRSEADWFKNCACHMISGK